MLFYQYCRRLFQQQRNNIVQSSTANNADRTILFTTDALTMLFSHDNNIDHRLFSEQYCLKNSLKIHEENTKKITAVSVVLYVIKFHVNLHKL